MLKDIPIKTILRNEEETRAIYNAKKFGLQYLDLRKTSPNPEIIAIIKEEDAKKFECAIISKVNDILNLVTPKQLNPFRAKFLDSLQQKGWRIKLFFVSQSAFNKIIDLYRFFTPPPPSLRNVLIIKREEVDRLKDEIKTIDELKNKIQVIEPNKLLKLIVSSAISLDASDIHLEPKKEAVLLRLRIDTILDEIVEFKKDMYDYLLSRIKILSGLKINVRTMNQDGRFTIKIEDSEGKTSREIDVRVSIIPGGNGEISILRLLGVGIKRLALEEIGLTKHYLDKFKFYLDKPNGLILTTGPTGSGKTTTLYSAISYIQDPKISIVTIEDPIEYKIEGINQSQVSAESGYDFPAALRAILRQDPDVILVGEIRDIDTAKTVMQAALTGHLVLSTTHTNDAPATISRLKELTLDEKEISSSLLMVIAQRLLRKLCNYCKEKYAPEKDLVESMKMVTSLISPRASVEIPQEISYLYKAKGCKSCFGLGYRGLVGVYEIMELSEDLERMILSGETSVFKIRAQAMEEGMITLLQDAILKTIWGITDLNEVRRVVGDFKYIESLYGHSVASVLTKSLKISPQTYGELKNLKTLEEIKKYLLATSYENILGPIGAIAVILRSTDIHIEPQEKDILIRIRIDGILENLVALPKEEFLPILAEIKIISNINRDVAGKSIDGRFKISLLDQSYNVRVSIIPGGYGETFVLRILRPDIEKVPFEDLGIRKDELQIIDRLIKKTKGMILATGPTSSGKSTTLFALISKINQPEIKVITIEDPIEYTVEGLVQTQINEDDGYTFSEALRHILRQNPNVILVGEIRDPETAKIAVQASMTGHLLLSTLHTIDSFSAIERFRTLGIDSMEVSDSLNAIIAQRLVRKLCDNCKQKTKLSDDNINLLKKVLEYSTNDAFKNLNFSKLEIYKNVGCEICGPTGYVGQLGVFEIFEINDVFQKMIYENAPVYDIKKTALQQGMILMQHDAILKIIAGLTTIEEYKRVFG